MSKNITSFIVVLILLSLILITCDSGVKYRQITVNEYLDKMKAGWIGQMAGVGWGGPTEFKWQNKIIPKDQMPEWQNQMINQFNQDDIYVEMTFLRTLEQYGLDVSIRQAGIDFANSRYMLWHANDAGRENLRSGIAPPFSGHPQYNSHADDIDYQIEADYAGLIAPGMPQFAVELGEKFGRLMNYGDGLYGGQFVAGMYAEAFFNSNIEEIVLAGLECIPAQSQYYECITAVINWYKTNPDNWIKTWELINQKYHLNPAYRKFSCSGATSDFNIDAKLNGAYIVMGLLYGKGNPDSTIIISTRCGQDSDCNPSNAAGILFTTLGMSKIPEKFKSNIDNETKFSYTEYNFPLLVEVCEKLTRSAVLRTGGKIETNSSDEEVFFIPEIKPTPGKPEQSWQPAPITEAVQLTPEEIAQIKIRRRPAEDFIHVWQVSGPYSKEQLPDSALFDIPFPPEKGDKKTANWQKMPMGENGFSQHLIQLDKLFSQQNCVAYLRTNIWSPDAREGILELGSDDGIKVWLNGELVHQNNVKRGLNPGEDIIKIQLKQGWNSCLMKITQMTGGWGATAVLLDSAGNTMKDVKFEAKE